MFTLHSFMNYYVLLVVVIGVSSPVKFSFKKFIVKKESYGLWCRWLLRFIYRLNYFNVEPKGNLYFTFNYI